ncbi:MAG: hypothetical protein AAGA05_14155 [Pseudomonadota bacterium]
MTPYIFETRGRRWSTLIGIAIAFTVLLGLYLVFDAAIWVLAIFALGTLPALWDFWADPRSGLQLDEDALTWWTGRANGRVGREEIDFIRLDTSWDFSVRLSAVLTNGRRIRLPYECTPPHEQIASVLDAQGIRFERHHFSLR